MALPEWQQTSTTRTLFDAFGKAGDDVLLDAVCDALAVRDSDRERLRAGWHTDGLTNPRKTRVAARKLSALAASVDARFVRGCGDCVAAVGADDGREPLLVDVNDCPLCGGSDDARALHQMTQACANAGVARLVVLGGSPQVRRRLAVLDDGPVEVRCVDGDTAQGVRAAEANKQWADVIVLLSASELPHSVAIPYTRDGAVRHKLVNVPRRGLSAMAAEVIRHVEVARGWAR